MTCDRGGGSRDGSGDEIGDEAGARAGARAGAGADLAALVHLEASEEVVEFVAAKIADEHRTW